MRLSLTSAILLSLALPVFANEITMPNVIGRTQTEAEKILNDAGLKFRALPGQSCVKTTGDVIVFGQQPPPGEKVNSDITATFLLPAVATGTISQFVGKSCASLESFRVEHKLGGKTTEIQNPPPKKVEKCNIVDSWSEITEQSLNPGTLVCDRLSLFATCTHSFHVDKTWVWNGSSCVGL